MPFTPREREVLDVFYRFGHAVRWGLYCSERVAAAQVKEAARAAVRVSQHLETGTHK